MCSDQPIPAEHLSSIKVCSSCAGEGCSKGSCQQTPSGAGVNGTDYMLYIRTVMTSACGEGGRGDMTLAYATPCQMDQVHIIRYYNGSIYDYHHHHHQ
jgi:hypothetical protein